MAPDRLIDVARRFESPMGIYVAAGLRILLGSALIAAAPGSRAPDAVRVLGIVVFLAGVITPWFGLERLHRVVAWWSMRGHLVKRAWAGLALILGLFLAYAVLPSAAE